MQKSMNVLPIMEDASITVTTQWGHITAVVELAGGCQAIVEHVHVCNHCFINNLSMYSVVCTTARILLIVMY